MTQTIDHPPPQMAAFTAEQMAWCREGEANRLWYETHFDELWSKHDGKHLLIFDGGNEVRPFEDATQVGLFLGQQPERVRLSAYHCWQYPEGLWCL